MEKAKALAVIAFLSGLALGATGLHVAPDKHGSNENNHQLEEVRGVLSNDFEKAIALDMPLASVWTKVANVDTNDVWLDATGSILAITRDGRAIQLFSYVNDIYYFDLFKAGDPRLTAEISTDADRLFVYERAAEGAPWVHFDREFDGVPDQRMQFGVDGSAQDIEWSLATNGEAE